MEEGIYRLVKEGDINNFLQMNGVSFGSDIKDVNQIVDGEILIHLLHNLSLAQDSWEHVFHLSLVEDKVDMDKSIDSPECYKTPFYEKYHGKWDYDWTIILLIRPLKTHGKPQLVIRRTSTCVH